MAQMRQTAPAILNNIGVTAKVTAFDRRMPMPRLALKLMTAAMLLLLALPARAECFVDYKAKQDDPLRLAYGVSQVSDAACGNPKQAGAELEPRLAADGWTLLKILSSFGPDGLCERKESAGEFYLRY
jgi:hypothetical protein